MLVFVELWPVWVETELEPFELLELLVELLVVEPLVVELLVVELPVVALAECAVVVWLVTPHAARKRLAAAAARLSRSDRLAAARPVRRPWAGWAPAAVVAAFPARGVTATGIPVEANATSPTGSATQLST